MSENAAPRRLVERWAWATLVANAVIIFTGGLVRLTGSGLGCPTWPRCTDSSFVPHAALGVHGIIEFSNRMLTYVLIAVVVAAFVVVWRWAGSTRSLRWHIGLIAAGVPLQGVIGGISVLTDLNPWVVGLHMILSMVLVAASMWLVVRVRGGAGAAAPTGARRLVTASFAVTWVVVWLGTVVTGSGPHAGDVDAPRNHLSPQVMSHVHAASVYLLLALTVATWLLLRRRGDGTLARAALVAAGGRAGPGRHRVRAVLHRPADRPRRGPPRRGGRPRGGVHPAARGDGVAPLVRGRRRPPPAGGADARLRPGARCPGPGALRAPVAQRSATWSSGSIATARKSTVR